MGNDKLISIRAVAEYLKKEGYEVSKSTVDNHVKAGKLKRSGRSKRSPFNLEDVEKYAEKYLAEDKEKSSVAIQYAEEEALSNLEIKKERAKLLRLTADEKAGKLVDKEYFDVQLASQTFALYGLLSGFAFNKAPDIINLVHGNNDLKVELERYLLETFRDMLRVISRDVKWEVLMEKGMIKLRKNNVSV